MIAWPSRWLFAEDIARGDPERRIMNHTAALARMRPGCPRADNWQLASASRYVGVSLFPMLPAETARVSMRLDIARSSPLAKSFGSANAGGIGEWRTARQPRYSADIPSGTGWASPHGPRAFSTGATCESTSDRVFGFG